MARVRELAGRPIAQHLSPNVGGRMSEHRGVVLHIAEGYFQGSINWQLNPDQRYADGTRVTTSSTWIVGREPGEWAQMADSGTIAWTQRDGSRTWLSIELVGFTRGHPLNPGGWEKPTTWQIEACAQLLAWAHRQHGIPLQVADSPSGRGLGHHSMGAPAWGHSQCPGPDIIAARGAIVARAQQIANEGRSGMDLDTRNTSFIRDGSPPTERDSNSVGHQLARSHQYAHRLVRALIRGDTRYGSLDAIASPGSEENPKPTSSSDPGRDNRSWRYALQRIWRWTYWTYNRAVSTEAKIDTVNAKLDKLADALASLAPDAGEVRQITAEDIAPYLEIVARDEPDTAEDAGDENDGEG